MKMIFESFLPTQRSQVSLHHFDPEMFLYLLVCMFLE